MADVTFVVSEAVKAGILDIVNDANVRLGNVADPDAFLMPNDGKTVLIIVGGAAASDVTFTQVNDKYGRAETTHLTFNPTVSKTSIVGPFKPELWNQAGGVLRFKPVAPVVTDSYLAVRVGKPT